MSATKAYPVGYTSAQLQVLADQRKAVDDLSRAASDAAYAQSIRQAEAAGERQRRINTERELLDAPYHAEHARLTTLRRRAAEQCSHAEAKAGDSPLDMALASDALAAEKCLLRVQLKLDELEREYLS